VKRLTLIDRMAWWWLVRRHPVLARYVVLGLNQETERLRREVEEMLAR
jgi:hypothetical protein